ncbi:hypothetical protein [Aminipila sp.]
MDTLRNWELNGLIAVKRKQNRYRVYTAEDGSNHYNNPLCKQTEF